MVREPESEAPQGDPAQIPAEGDRPGPPRGTAAPGERDLLFDRALGPVRPFEFDSAVARVFPDMIARSVPGYAEMVALTGLIARRFARPGTRCYDLGCALGASTQAVLRQTGPGLEVIAVDSSRPMIEGLAERLAGVPGAERVQALCADCREVPIEGASVVILNLTLQFLPPADRLGLLRRIRSGLVPGGALILVEKTRLPEGQAGRHLAGLYDDFKRAQGYSELAIAGKRAALERVLIPDSIETHESRLAAAGLAGWTRWYQACGFVAWLAWT